MPTLGPFVAEIIHKNDNPTIQRALEWCYIELTDQAYVTTIRHAAIILNDRMHPETSAFIDCPFEETRLYLFDPAGTPPNNVYSLVITENRELIRFRSTETTPSTYMFGETYNAQGAWLIKQPLQRFATYGLTEADNHRFTDTVDSRIKNTSQTHKERLLSQYQARVKQQHQPLLLAQEPWLAQRERLAINWRTLSKRIRTGFKQEGFLAEWITLKRESTTSYHYCLALIALLGTLERRESANQKLDSAAQESIQTLLKYLQPDHLARFHTRWLAETTETTPTASALQKTYAAVTKLIFKEFKRYQQTQSDVLITSFSRSSLFAPSFEQPVDNSETETLIAATSILDSMADPEYFDYALLQDMRTLERDLNAIINADESHWCIQARMLALDPRPGFNHRLTEFATKLAKTRRQDIKKSLCDYADQWTPAELTEIENDNIQALFITTDDIITGLQSLVDYDDDWQAYVIGITKLDEIGTPFIKNIADFTRITNTLNSNEQKNRIIYARPITDWLALIHSAKELHDFFTCLPFTAKGGFFTNHYRTFGRYITSDESLLQATQTFSINQLKTILTIIPDNIKAHFMQTPLAINQLLQSELDNTSQSKIQAILDAIPISNRLLAISTLDKFTAAFEKIHTTQIMFYLNLLSTNQWNALLENPLIWLRARDVLDKENRLAILSRLSPQTWLVFIRSQSTLADRVWAHVSSELFACLLIRAQNADIPQDPTYLAWPKLKQSITAYLNPISRPQFFSTSNTPYPISATQLYADIVGLKISVLSSYCNSSIDPKHALRCFKAALLIKAYESQPLNVQLGVRVEPEGPPKKLSRWK